MSSMSLNVPEKVWSLLLSSVNSLIEEAVVKCGVEYSFDGAEAIHKLDLIASQGVIVKGRKNDSRKNDGKDSRKNDGVDKLVSSFPLPYNGEMDVNCCSGLKQNHGLYTQCQSTRKVDDRYCKGCKSQADKNANGEPDYGTIEKRKETGLLDFKDPSGKSPIAYTKIMKKFKKTEEEVVEEGKRMNMNINAIHFVVPSGSESKRGRPKSVDKKEDPKPKGVKGRPKKSKTVVEIEGNSEDLFASLVASASSESDTESDSESASTVETKLIEPDAKALAKAEAKEQEKAAKAQAKAEALAKEKADKALAKEKEKAAKEEEKAATKAAKEKALADERQPKS